MNHMVTVRILKDEEWFIKTIYQADRFYLGELKPF